MSARPKNIRKTRRRLGLRACCAMSLAGLSTILLAPTAEAHSIGLSRGEYRATKEGLTADIVLAQAELLAVVPALDPDHDGIIDEQAVAKARRPLEVDVVQKILVTRGGASCSGELVDAALTEQDGLRLRGRYVCAGQEGDALSARFPLLDELSHGHRHAARVISRASAVDKLLFRGEATFEIPAQTDASSPPSTASSPSHWTGFVRMGTEHILTGYDHLLFLFALVLRGGSFASLAWAITSFTVAHCLTLALTVLGVVSLPSGLVEPAIALSVAYAGAETLLFPKGPRFRIAFPFGLLHGFGFAGALAEVAIPPAEVPAVLASFNLGVEIGQLAWIVVLGFLLHQLRKLDWFARRAIPTFAVTIACVGLVWFVDRADLWHG